MQLVKGILFILILSRVSEIIGLRTVAFLMQSAIQLFGFGMIVLFQPELRRALEKLGSSGFQDILLKRDDEERLKTIASIEAIVKACASCAEDYIGALIVIERDTKIGDIVSTGTRKHLSMTEPSSSGTISSPRPPVICPLPRMRGCQRTLAHGIEPRWALPRFLMPLLLLFPKNRAKYPMHITEASRGI
jgi:DNA integrity scanning protein DisA with diadenylate cyclase activity